MRVITCAGHFLLPQRRDTTSCVSPLMFCARRSRSALGAPVLRSALMFCAPVLRSALCAPVLRSALLLCALRSALCAPALRSCSALSALRSCSAFCALRSCSALMLCALRSALSALRSYCAICQRRTVASKLPLARTTPSGLNERLVIPSPWRWAELSGSPSVTRQRRMVRS